MLFVAAGQCLGWPLARPGLAGWLLYAPLAVYLALWLRPALRRDGAAPPESRAETILVVLGAWTFLQAIGISGLRGGEVATRHRDVLIFGVWANALALLLLLRGALAPRARRLAAAGAALWVCAVATGFVLNARHTWREELPEWRSQAREQLVHVQDFLATDDPAHLEGKPLFAIPHPKPELLIGALRDPSVRSVLPPVIRDPLPLAAADGGDGEPGSAHPEIAPPAPGLPFLVAPGAGGLRSEPIETQRSALQFAVAGAGLPAGAAPELRLVDAADGVTLRSRRCRRSRTARGGGSRSRRRAGARSGWRRPRSRALRPARWIAVAAPKEVGRLSHRLVPLTAPAAAGALALAGVALLALGARALRSS